ncbi:MAG: hypothetical protein IH623_15850 [Verrucomicrobia bacterium]|nr:hypothetical protein [Verrucomicrobiota bacterium]
MKENEILEEIHRIRAENAAECGYDVNVMFARMDAELERLKAEGWNVVSPAPRENETAAALHDKPAPKQE